MELYINISRFHPLIVHLPIGILVFAFLMEIYQKVKKSKDLNVAINLALLVSFVAALGSTITGFFLAKEGGYDVILLNRHKWLGIGLVGFSLGLYFSKNSAISWLSKTYNFNWFVTLILLTVTGHYGGSLTHGSDYLFTNKKETTKTIANIEKANVYSTIIQPILKAKCNGCHNPSKAKGDLIMTTKEGLLKGGENGSIFNFEEVEKSELLVRIHLDLNDDLHMPPKGKSQLEEDEIALLTWWIENKACFECKVEETKGKETVESLLKKYEQSTTDIANFKVDKIDDKTIKKLNQSGIKTSRLSENSDLLIIDLANKTISKSTLKQLKKVGENVIELNLSNTNFSDGNASIFKRLPHLQKLQLQQTKITDKTISKLKNLAFLESLNLYGTNISDVILEDLKKVKSLKRLYVWQTKITEKGISRFHKSKPLVEIQYEIDESFFGKAELLPPVIIADSELFMDSIVVSLESNFRKTTLHYTLDGTIPDESSAVYKTPLVLEKTAKIKAFAIKKDWKKSDIIERQFIKTTHPIQSVELSKKPNGKYAAQGAKTLNDLEKGTLNFTDGKWLGYEGEHITLTLNLEKPTEIQSLFVSALANPGGWIFFPQGFKVEVSENGKNFKTVYDKMLSPLEEKMDVEMKYFEASFPKTTAKMIRVKVFSLLKNPVWHPSAGEKCWLFLDEIMVN